MSRRLKILISAYACEPGKGSEPEVGWQWTTRLARWHDITVVTRSNNEPSIRAGLAKLPEPHPQFIFLDLASFWQLVKKCGLPVQWYYVLWQFMVARKLRARLIEFDLIHHLTFNAFRWPGVWWFSPRPVLLGPLGGGQICPPKMLPLFGWTMPVEFSRSLLVRFSKWNPLHRLNAHKAIKILVANQDTAKCIPEPYRHKVQLVLETGIEPVVEQSSPPKAASNDGLHLIWVGVLEKRKALPLAIRALALASQNQPGLRLTVIGRGPEETRLKQLANNLGVQDHVDWRGRLPRAEVGRLLNEHDMFLFTSVRDTSGNVVLEAMLAGLPVITLNHQGAAEMTTEATALRIQPTTIRHTVAELAQAILRLAADAELRKKLGRAGRDRVLAHYTWAKKAEQMNAVYQSLLLK